jgi:lysozyme
MAKITKIGSAGLALIKASEGFSAKPYKCPAGVPTIGYGCTYYPDKRKVTLQDPPITEAQASAMLQAVLEQYERDVDSFATDTLTQNQFDALVDFAYNAGSGNLKCSTLLKKVNANPNDPTIRNEFMRWVFGGDGSHNGVDDNGDGRIDEPGERQKLKGLVVRRLKEADLYFS